jgi:predicted nucleic acid-binding protein
MIAADSSAIISFLEGNRSREAEFLATLLQTGDAVLPPAVLSEVLSDPKLPARHRELIQALPLLELLDGYWVRAGLSRAKLLSSKLKAPLADTLIAQSCIDHGVALITRDPDFRHFAKHCGLKLA